MISIEKFIGKTVEIPEAYRYVSTGGWEKVENDAIIFGLGQPALILAKGLNDLEQLVGSGKIVQEGDTIAFAIT